MQHLLTASHSERRAPPPAYTVGLTLLAQSQLQAEKLEFRYIISTWLTYEIMLISQ